MRNEKGFTLIEIVMVIILLGILAAVAVPRFIDLSNQAKLSATKGALGGVRGAIAISYANNAIHGHAGYPTLAQLPAILVDGTLPGNPYAATNETTKNEVEAGTTNKTKTTLAGAGADKEWRYNATTGQFWSAVSGGVGANGF